MEIHYSKKKEELRKDPVMDAIKTAVEFVKKFKKEFTVAVSAIAVIVVVAGVFLYMKTYKTNTAKDKFSRAFIAYSHHDYDVALPAFDEVIDGFSATSFALYSKFLKASIIMSRGDYSTAADLFLEVSDASLSIDFISARAIEAAAKCLEFAGKESDALKYYKMAEKHKLAAERVPEIRWQIVLLAKKMGDNSTALEYCNRIINDKDYQMFKSDAENIKAIIESM